MASAEPNSRTGRTGSLGMGAVAAAAVAAVDAEAAAAAAAVPAEGGNVNAGETNGSGAVPASNSQKLLENTLRYRRIYSSKGRDIGPEASQGHGSFPTDPSVPPSGPATSAISTAAVGAAGPDTPKAPPKDYSRAYSTKTFQKHAGAFGKKAVDRFSHKQSGWVYTLLLAYSTIGTIYGDLGTSPLYTVGAVFGRWEEPDETDFLGVASCIFWTITLVPLLEYVFIILYADDLGEGGTFALYSNLCRNARISLLGTRVNPELKEQLVKDFTQHGTRRRSMSGVGEGSAAGAGGNPGILQGIQESGSLNGSGGPGKAQEAASSNGDGGFSKAQEGGAVAEAPGLVRFLPRGSRRRAVAILERFWSLRQLLLVLTLLGTCGVLADGVLTPSISVLSAVGGLSTAHVALSNEAIVGISVGILVALFFIQQFGTSRISVVFSPVILIWLLGIAAVGVYNIATYMPGVFKAISPWYAFQFFSRNGFESWVSLGEIVLSITGSEALFADMGHFSRTSIQIAFSALVYPCVLLSYFGQIAYLSRFPENASNAFFASVPISVFWPVFVVATMAAVVASQALITGAFSIIKQSMTLSCFPRSKIVHTSDDHEGQIYIPAVNWTLMVMCVAVTAGFRSSTAIGNAYGVTVVMVMLLTTTLVSTVMMVAWDLSLLVVLPFWLFYTAFQGVYFSSTLYKVPNGGWFPLVLSAVLLFIMYTWHFGTYKKKHYAREHNPDEATLKDLLATAAPVEGAAIVYSEVDDGVPPVLLHYMANIPAIQKVVVCLTVKQLPVPRLDDDHRLFVAKMSYKGTPIAGFYRAAVFYGYKEVCDHGEEFLRQLWAHVAQCTCVENRAPGAGGTLERAVKSMARGAVTKDEKGGSGKRTKSLTRTVSAWEESLVTRTDEPELQGGGAREGEEVALTIPPDGDLNNSKSLYERADSARELTQGPSLGSDQWASRAFSDVVSEEQAVEDAWGFNQVYFMGRTQTTAGAKATIPTRFLLRFYGSLKALSSSQANHYRVPSDRLLEVGMVYTID